MAFIGDPPLSFMRPAADEVHISVTFTWDLEEGYRLQSAWAQYYKIVRIGGPALGDCPSAFVPFVPRRYIKEGVTFTSVGCDNNCPWCLVPKREGKFKELKNFAPGHIVQDNNILQASKPHLGRVADMLHEQARAAIFSGGLQPSLVDAWAAAWLRGLRIETLFLSADTNGALTALRRAVDGLDFLRRNSNKLRCYVMIGYAGETIEQAVERLQAVWDAGCLPFAQLYQPAGRYIKYPLPWTKLARTWSRPAGTRALQKQIASNRD